jgi:hypothetical protein
LQEKKAQRPATEHIQRSESFRHSSYITSQNPTESKSSFAITGDEGQSKNVEAEKAPPSRLESNKTGASAPFATEPPQQTGEKQKFEAGVRLVSLPSLTPPKAVAEPPTLESSYQQINKSIPHHLSVQVEDSMDEPISYPLTSSSFPIQPHPSAEPEITYSKSPNKAAGSVTFGPNLVTSVPTNPQTPISAKKILKRTGSGGGGGEPVTSPQSQQISTPKRHTMPTWLSPNTSVDLGASTSPLSRSKENAALRHVQEKLEEVTLQKDATERYLRLEIESLKNRLDGGQDPAQPSTATTGGPSQHSLYASVSELNHHERDDELRAKIAALQEENRLLKEESMIDKVKHHRELTHLKERHQADLDLGNIAKVEEIALLEKRHRDTIEALKKIHLDELNAIKQRAKDGVALDQLSSQIAVTTGSLKLIEEQMNLKYRGVDAVREGQYEARERLLIEMEQKAVERAEAAESEGFKLKGLLSHMEQVNAFTSTRSDRSLFFRLSKISEIKAVRREKDCAWSIGTSDHSSASDLSQTIRSDAIQSPN